MSKYTTELRFICESKTGHDSSVGYNSTADVIEEAAPIIFDFDYPIFDENYKLPLETKIIRHFYTREICEETYGLWKLRLEDRMNMIMPYYNKLYEAELLKFNPFYDVEEMDYYYKSVIWAINNGITSGKDATHFAPKKACTRAEVVQMLYSMNKYLENNYSKK